MARSKVLGLAAIACAAFACLSTSLEADEQEKTFRAGAAAVDITPTRFPVIVNGYFNERTAEQAHDRLMARALVLDDGNTPVAIVVVDNLMIPRELLDEAKATAEQATDIAADRMLISATHTHSTPAVMGCLGSGEDPAYRQWLPDQLAKAIVLAAERLVPAQIGWAVVEDDQHNHCRRWIFRSDRIQTDPFGEKTVRAHMHPGYQSADHVGPSGPADTDLSLLAVQTPDGRPLAILANYAMHYYGAPPVSGDFCGRFGNAFARQIGIGDDDPTFVGMMSQGTSGDSMWMDYTQPEPHRDLDAYTEAVARKAKEAYDQVEYRSWVPLAMAETTLRLGRRVPDPQRLEWAKEMLEPLEGSTPQERPAIYAREQIYLHEEPEVEIKLQAVRIGQLGITAIPNEVYGITGLKLKARSPLTPTFNIELANGAQGYIPPPEQHHLGGYTTWPARTAGLEVEAEPKIVSTLLELLEKVSGQTRRAPSSPEGDYAKSVLKSEPQAYWRLDELQPPQAVDAAGDQDGSYENGVAFYLPGPSGTGFATTERGNRAVHFAGGRLSARLAKLGDKYSVEFWFWNALPTDARPVTGYMFSRGADGDSQAAGDHLGIGGTHDDGLSGKLIFFNGNERDELLVGRTRLAAKTWHHVVLTRDGTQLTAYLNGNAKPEISGQAAPGYADDAAQLFFGGRSDNLFNLEGKLDEVAVYDRVLSPSEVVEHFEAAGSECHCDKTGSGPSTASTEKE